MHYEEQIKQTRRDNNTNNQLIAVGELLSVYQGREPDIFPWTRQYLLEVPTIQKRSRLTNNTRSSADADNRRDAFSGQSRSTNSTIPLGIVSYCTIITLSFRRTLFTIFDFKKCRDLEIGSEVIQCH